MIAKQQQAPMRRRHGTQATPPSSGHGRRLLMLLVGFLLMLVLLMACSGPALKSTQRPIEPTPVVACNEHQPADLVPPDAVPPAVESPDQLDIRHAGAAEFSSQYRQLYAYVLAKDQRDVVVAGVVEQLRDQRAATAKCLDDARRRGVIL